MRGRPTKITAAKNRVHSIVLTEKSELIYRKITAQSGTKWFSEFINQKLIDSFENDLEYKKHLLLEAQKERDAKEKEICFLVEEIRNLKEKSETDK